MAAPSATLNNIDALNIQKRVYLNNKIYDQFEEGTVLHDIVDSGSEVTDAVKMSAKWEGEHVAITNRTNKNPNLGRAYNSESQENARPGHNQYTKTRWIMAEINSAYEMSELAKIKNRGDPQSVDDILAIEIDGQITGNRKRVSEMMHGDGSELITTAAAAASWNNTTKVLTVDSADYFVDKEGMEIIARHKTTGALSVGWPTINGAPKPMLIQSVDAAADTVTVTDQAGGVFDMNDAADTVDDMGIYPYDAQGKGMWGIGIACDDANPSAHGFDPAAPPSTEIGSLALFGGVNRLTNSWWRGNDYDANTLGGSTTPSIRRHIAPFLNILSKRTGGKMGWLLGVTGFDVQACLAEDLSRMQRTAFTYELEGGYEAVKYNNLWTVVDHDGPYTELRVLEVDAMFQYIPDPWHIDDSPGGSWDRKLGPLGRGMQVFTCYFVTRRQLFWNRVMATGRITGFAAAR